MKPTSDLETALRDLGLPVRVERTKSGNRVLFVVAPADSLRDVAKYIDLVEARAGLRRVEDE
jgi:hypothetical protein